MTERSGTETGRGAGAARSFPPCPCRAGWFLLLGIGLLTSGCGPRSGADATADLVRATLTRARREADLGRTSRARALYQEALRTGGTASADLELRARVLQEQAGFLLDTGHPAEAQRALWELRSMGVHSLPVTRAAARAALGTGRDLSRSLRELEDRGRTREDRALAARLALRLGEERPPAPGPGPEIGVQERLLQLETAPTWQAARSLAERWPPLSPGDPGEQAELEAELLALELDSGAPVEDLAPRLAAHPWEDLREFLGRRGDWLRQRPGNPEGSPAPSPALAPEAFRRLRLGGPEAPDRALDLLASLGETASGEFLPGSPRRPLEDRSEGQWIDRDPVSRRREEDGVQRLVLVTWPGLSAHYLSASLEAGHFPFLRALGSRGIWLSLPAPQERISPPAPVTGPLRPSVPERAFQDLLARDLPGTWAWVGRAVELREEERVRPWQAPPERIPRSLGEGREQLLEERLFPLAPPEPRPRVLLERLLAMDREVGLRAHRAALAREELGPRGLVLELPPLDWLRDRLLPLQTDCAPGGETLRGLLAARQPGFDGVLDRLVGRLDTFVARLVPSLDRDDYVLVTSPRGQAGEGGFLLAAGPGFPPGLRQSIRDLPPGALAELVSWLLAERGEAPPPAFQEVVRARIRSPFLGR